jgi:hypothetical protein
MDLSNNRHKSTSGQYKQRKGSNSAKHEIPSPVYEGTQTHIHRENPEKKKKDYAKKRKQIF